MKEPISTPDKVIEPISMPDKVKELYHSEFIRTLIKQAVDKNDRYKPVNHKQLHMDDLVLLVEDNTKRYMYPMGRVIQMESNDFGETTAARILKGERRPRLLPPHGLYKKK